MPLLPSPTCSLTSPQPSLPHSPRSPSLMCLWRARRTASGALFALFSLFATLALPSHAAISPTERAALVALYQSTQGATWSNTANVWTVAVSFTKLNAQYCFAAVLNPISSWFPSPSRSATVTAFAEIFCVPPEDGFGLTAGFQTFARIFVQGFEHVEAWFVRCIGLLN